MNLSNKINLICLILGTFLMLISFIPPLNNNGYGLIITFYMVPLFGIGTLIYNIHNKQYKFIIWSIILLFSFPLEWFIGYIIYL